MGTNKLVIASALLSFFSVTGCGIQSEDGKKSDKRSQENRSEGGGGHRSGDDKGEQKKGVSMHFALPEDVKRAHQVSTQEASAETHGYDPATSCGISDAQPDVYAKKSGKTGDSATSIAIAEPETLEARVCSDDIGYPVPVQDSRIRISCVDDLPFVKLPSFDQKIGSYFDIGGVFWAAPTLRVGLEEMGPEVASYGISEMPYFCPGDALIEVVGLRSDSVYAINAELLDFDYSPLYAGSTEQFKVANGEVTSVSLHMQRVNGGGDGVAVIDVIFEDGAESDPQPPVSLPEPMPVPAGVSSPGASSATAKK